MVNVGIKELQKELLIALQYFDFFCKTNQLEYFMMGGTLLGSIRDKKFISWDDDADLGMTRTNYEKFLALSNEFNNDEFEIEHFSISKKVCHPLIRIKLKKFYFKNLGCYKKKYFSNLFFDIFPIDFVPDDPALKKDEETNLLNLKKKLYLKTTFSTDKNPIIRLVKNIYRLFIFSSPYSICKKIDKISYNPHETDFYCSKMSKYSYEKQTIPRDVYDNVQYYEFNGIYLLGPVNYHCYLSRLFGNYFIPKQDPFITINEVFKKE